MRLERGERDRPVGGVVDGVDRQAATEQRARRGEPVASGAGDRRRHVRQGHLAAYPFTRAGPGHERGRSLRRRPLRPGEVDDEGGGHPPFAEQTCHCLVGEVVTGRLRLVARVADDVDLADLRVPRVHGLEVEPEPAQRRRPRAGDEDVCGSEELVDLGPTGVGLQVDPTHLLTDVQLVVVVLGELLHRVTARGQDRHDARPLPGQPRDGGRPGQVDGDRDDADAGQGAGHVRPCRRGCRRRRGRAATPTGGSARRRCPRARRRARRNRPGRPRSSS